MPSSRTFRPADPPSFSQKASPDPFLDFPRESDVYPELSTAPSPSTERFARAAQSPSGGFALIAAGTALLTGVVLIVMRYAPDASWPADFVAAPAPVVISESTATLTSTPDDADVYIDGVRAGRTPISLSLPVGVRLAELRSGQASSRSSLNIEAGKITAQHVEFAKAPLTGALEVASDPRGARVSVDGVPRGQTPLRLPELAPGQHRVTISRGRTSVERRVVVTAGAAATVVVVWRSESPSEQPNPRPLSASLLRPTDAGLAAPNRAIYTALDREVTAPVELERKLPAWNPPVHAASRWFGGVVQVVVDERGSVESAQLVRSLADFYDAGLLEAARKWRFKPALLADQPVKYRKIVEITMSPRPGPPVDGQRLQALGSGP